MKCIILIIVTILLLHECNSQYEYFKRKKSVEYEIAGIFKDKSGEPTLAFNETTSKANLNDTNIRLKPVFLHPVKADSFAVWKQLCEKKQMQPIAIFGPQSAISDGAIREQCALAHIPHLQAAWQPYDANINSEELEESGEEITYKNITVNFYPDADEIATAYAQLLKFYHWENFAVLYEDDFSLMRVQKILALHTTNHPIFIRRLHPNEENREVFKELKKYQESRILIDCNVDNIMKYMEIAQSLDIVDHYQHYIMVSLDTGMYADSLKVFPSNITWLSLTEHEKLSTAGHFLSSRVHAWSEIGDLRPVYKFHVEALLMFDVANHVVHSINKVQEAEENKLLPPESSICDEEVTPWEHGAALQNQILNSNSLGVTGNIQFNPSTGKRSNYTLFVNEVHVNVLRTIAEWQSTNPEQIEVVNNATSAGVLSATKEFVVVSKKAKPYFEIIPPCDEEDEKCDNSKRFQGFAVDLVEEIFKVLRNNFKLNYSYVFKHEEDKSYGRYNPLEKKWDGLIGDLLDKKADLAVCDLTITEERKKVVDFSVPFMTLGISILFTKIDEIPPSMFSFLNPYSLDVWLYIATAYCGVSVVLFLCARISPADWENPQPCDKDPEELENIWNFKNCAWLTMGSIMTQGCDILPKAFGSRWVCAMWWFFAVIVCQTYIAQLSASMTSAMADEAINDVEDLAKQSKVMYGAVKGGSTVDFFKNSNDKMYRTMYEKMVANDEVLLAKTNDEGEARVLNGRNKYAFFMESTTIEYKMERNCRLKKVGGLLDSKDYGIAMPANSPFRTDINTAILILKEKTILTKIKDKWWNNTDQGAPDCDKKVDEYDVEGDLEVNHLIGAFVVLIGGIGISLLITAAEFFDEVRNIVIREQVTHKEAFIKELKASLNFTQLQKPVLRNPSRAPSIVSTKSQLDVKQAKRAQVIENFMDLEKVVQ